MEAFQGVKFKSEEKDSKIKKNMMKKWGFFNFIPVETWKLDQLQYQLSKHFQKSFLDQQVWLKFWG